MKSVVAYWSRPEVPAARTVPDIFNLYESNGSDLLSASCGAADPARVPRRDWMDRQRNPLPIGACLNIANAHVGSYSIRARSTPAGTGHDTGAVTIRPQPKLRPRPGDSLFGKASHLSNPGIFRTPPG